MISMRPTFYSNKIRTLVLPTGFILNSFKFFIKELVSLLLKFRIRGGYVLLSSRLEQKKGKKKRIAIRSGTGALRVCIKLTLNIFFVQFF